MKASAEPLWPRQGAPPIRAACAVCHTPGPHPAAVSIENLAAGTQQLHFLRCGACGSLTATGGALFEYTDADVLDDAMWRHYLQVGAGIESMVQPPERVRAGRDGLSLLDVGCGFGYVLDYWRNEARGVAAGVEPSEYGRLGRDLLGAEIHLEYLADATALHGRRFDIVYSSEVIEHVPDPAAFLRELAGYLAPGGTLVLTTPRAEFVVPGSPLSTVVAALSPGFHKLLLSAPALGTALRAAGFGHVVVEAEAERLVAFASAAPLALAVRGDADRRAYVGYLADRTGMAPPHLDLALGFRFRAMKELVNLGRLDEARPHAAAYAQMVQAEFGLDVVDPAMVRARLAVVRDFAAYAAALPFSLGPWLYYRGMIARVSGEHADAAMVMDIAEAVLAHGLSIAPQHFQETATLLWRAVFERGCAQFGLGHDAEGLATLNTIPSAPGDADGALRFAALPPDLPLRIATEAQAARQRLAAGSHVPAAAPSVRNRLRDIARAIRGRLGVSR